LLIAKLWFMSRWRWAILLEHLFAPIMARFEESSMGLPIIGSQYLVSYSFWVI